MTALAADESSIFFMNNSNNEAEKIYYAIEILRQNPDRTTYQNVHGENVSHGIVEEIDGMEGHKFEYLCADLLRKNGFSDVRVTKGSGDQGVDILAIKDGIKYAIQCKNYSSPLGNTPIQEINAGKTYYNCHVGVVLTNSTFTPGAKALAQATGVLLWDRSTLQSMIQTLD